MEQDAIQIDFTWGADFLMGADVEIDGAIMDTLEKYGSQFVTGFRILR